MISRSFSNWLRGNKKQPIRKAKRQIERKAHLKLETLEDRVVPAFTAGDIVGMELAASSNNTTGTIIQLAPTGASQTPTINFSIPSTGSTPLRFSNSGTSTYLSDSNDGTLLVMAGYATTDTTDSDLSVVTAQDPASDRTVATLNNAVTLNPNATSYTGISGNQTRSATTANDTSFYITDKGGVYTNGAVTTGNGATLNTGEARAFGGTVYISSTRTTAQGNPGGAVDVAGALPSSTLTGMTGVPVDANIVDFYLVQSGTNGSTYDTLYSADAGSINKFTSPTGAAGTWTARGSYTGVNGIESLIAAPSGTGSVNLYVTTGTSVIAMTDTSAFTSNISVTTGNNVTLFTATSPNTVKSIAFAPIAAGSSAPSITSANSTNVFYQNAASTFSVTATGSPAPTFSLTGAPSWITINSTTGLLSINTPSAPTETSTQNYSFTITATNGVGTPASQTFTVSVVFGAPTITSANSTSIYASQSGSFQVVAQAGPPINGYGLSGAPSWVTINSSTGLITMTNAPAVTTTTNVSFTVNVSNSAGTTPQTFTITELPTISYATQGSNYTQNFNSLPDAGGTATIGAATGSGQFDLTLAAPAGFGASTNTAVAGWYAVNLDGPGGAERFAQGEPSTTTGALFDFNDGNPGSQALGTISTSTTASRFGAVFINNTNTTLNTFTLSYIGEEWWANSGAGTGLTFSYSIGSPGLQTVINPTNPVGSLGFSAPVTGTTTSLDGSQSPNQASVTGTVNNISWGPGQVLTIQWDKGTTGSSDGLGIANVQFSASFQAQFQPTITNAPSAYATVGNTSSYQLTANAAPAATWSLSGFNGGTVPSWVTVNTSTGLLTFTTPPTLPTNGADAAFTFVVTANNGVGTAATQTFTVIETNPASNFTAGDLLLYQTGNNNASDPEYAAEAPVSLQEITTTGTPVENVPVPDNLTVGGTANQPLSEDLGTTATKNGTGDGLLELSYDGTQIAFTGNDDQLNATDFSTSNRVIGIVGNNPSSLNTSTYGDFNGGDDSRGAVVYNNGNIYEFGHTVNGGLRDFSGAGNSPTVGTEVDTATTKNNVRDAIVGFNGQVYYSSAKSAIPGIFISETSAGVPVFQPTAPGVDTEVIQDPDASGNPNGMFLADMNGDGVLDTGDLLYFVDSANGLYVSTYTSPTGTNLYGTWSTPVAVNGGDPVTTAVNYVGLTGQVTGSGVQLYFTSADGTGNSSVWSLVDTGSPTQTAIQIASTASSNGGMQYEGVAYAPFASATSISLTINGSSSGTVAATTGSTVTFVATVPASLNGTMVYFDNAATQTTIGSAMVVSGTATFTTNSLNSGQYTVEAYTGGINGSVSPAASSTINLSLTGSTPSQSNIALSLNPTTVNEATTITATIAPTSGTGAYPTGTVSFYSNGQLLGTVNLSAGTQGAGSAVTVTLTTTALALAPAPSSDSVDAIYTGDNTYTAATSNTVSEVVNPGATITVSTSNASPAWNAGSPPLVTLTATVTGNGLGSLPNGSPTGQIQFYLYDFPTGTVTNIGGPVNLTQGSSANVYTAHTSYTFTTPGSVVVEAEYLPGGTSQYASVSTQNNSVPGVIDTAVQAFGVGDLVALERPGQASNASNPVYLIEFNPNTNSIVQQVILPFGSNGSTNIVGLSPHASTEGALALSANGSYLTLEGFDLTIGTASATSSDSATVARTTASITNAGVINTSTAVLEPALNGTTGEALQNVRGAVTFDGQEYWIAGDSSSPDDGLQYASNGATSSTGIDTADAGSSYTDVQIISGNLYVAGGTNVISEVSGATDLAGTTLPTDAAITALPGLATAYASANFTSPAPYGFLLFNSSSANGLTGAPNLLYVGDQNYGLLKFYFNGTDWVFAGERLNNSGSIEGLTGTWDGTTQTATLYMTAAQGTGFPGNQIATITDSAGYNQPFTPGNIISDVYTLPNGNTSTFSGIAFAPLPMANVSFATSPNPTTYGTAVTLTATVTTNNTGTGTPTGSVDFFDGSTYLGTGTLNGSGVAKLTTSALPVGADSITARYDGDTNNGGNTSSPTTETVNYAAGDIIVDEVGTDATIGTIQSTTVTGSGSSTVVTINMASATGLVTGQAVMISGDTAVTGLNNINNGTYTVTVPAGSTTSFTITGSALSGLANQTSASGTVSLALNGTATAATLEDWDPSTMTQNTGNAVAMPTGGTVVSITSITETGTTVTVTSPTNFSGDVGDEITIANAGDSFYNGTYEIMGTGGSTGAWTFTYVNESGIGNAIPIKASPSGATDTSNIATITATVAEGFTVGQSVVISGVGVAAYNNGGSPVTILSVPSSTSFTYALVGTPAASGGGTVTLSSATGGQAVLATTAVTEDGTPGSTSQGYIETSLDGESAAIAGYDQVPGFSIGSSSSGPNDAIATLSPNGSLNTSTQIGVADDSGGFTPAMRAVATVDGQGFWVATGNFARYVPFDNTPLPSFAIVNASESGKTATITTSVASSGFTGGLTPGETIEIEGVGSTTGATVSGYNGTFVILSTPTTTTFTFTVAATAAQGTGSGGTASIPSSVQLDNFYSNPYTIGLSPTDMAYLVPNTGAQSSGIPAIDAPAPIGDGAPVTGVQGGDSLVGFNAGDDPAANFPTTDQFAFSPNGQIVFVADSNTDGYGGLLEYQAHTFAGITSWTEINSAQQAGQVGFAPLTISSVTVVGTTVTVTTSGTQTLSQGQQVTIAGFTSPYTGYNGTFVVTSANNAGNTFQFTDTTSGLTNDASASGATVSDPDGGLRGLTASFSGNTVTLYGTTTDTFGNRVVEITGTLNGSGNYTLSAPVTVATAPANEAFRGVALAPQAAGATATTTTLAVDAHTDTYGTEPNFTATVATQATGVAPSGYVSFRNNANGQEFGTAQLVATPVGSSRTITSFTVTGTSVTAHTSSGTFSIGQIVTITGETNVAGLNGTFTVTGTGTNQFSFTDTNAGIATDSHPTAGTSAQANTYTATLAAVGNLASSISGSATYSVDAVYTGNPTYAASAPSATQSVTIDQQSPSVTPSVPSDVTSGQTYTLTATIGVTPTSALTGDGVTYNTGVQPTGTVSFYNVTSGNTLIGTAGVSVQITNVSGEATYSFVTTLSATAPLSLGSYTINAVYSGDQNFAGSNNNTTTLNVVNTTTTAVTTNFMSTNPTASTGQSVNLTATVTSASDTTDPIQGSVQFYDDLIPIGSPVTVPTTPGPHNTAVFTTTVSSALVQALSGNPDVLTPGLHSITAVFTPTGTTFGPSTGVYEQTVAGIAVTGGDSLVERVGDGVTSLIAPSGSPFAGSASIGSTIFIDDYHTATIVSEQTASGTTTVTTNGASGFIPGEQVTINGASDTTYDGSETIVMVSGNMFTYTDATSDGLGSTGGIATSIVQSIILPTADGTGTQANIRAIVADAQQSNTAGQLTLSGNGQYLFTTGYDTTVNLANPANIPSAPELHYQPNTPRAVARINLAGIASTSSQTVEQTIGFTPGTTNAVETAYNITGVYSPDGNQYYLTGGYSSNGQGVSGVDYFSSFTTSSSLVSLSASGTISSTSNSGPNDATGVENYNGNLVVMGLGSPPTYNGAVQQIQAYSGMPTSAAAPTTLPGLTADSNSSPEDVYFTHLGGTGAPAGINTLYLTDEANFGVAGSITKWSLQSNGTWTLTDTIDATATDLGFAWLAGTNSGSGVTLYTTYGNGGDANTGSGDVYTVTDTNGWNQTFSSTTITTLASQSASSLETIRGIALAPYSPTITTTASAAVTLGTTAPTISDSAVLANGNNETGNLVFVLDLGATQVYTTSDPLSGNGTYGASYTLPTTGTVTGTYTWHVTYAGDPTNEPATDQGGTAEQTVVSAASPGISTSTTNINLGSTTNDQATLTGPAGYFPTGTVTFNLYNNATGTGPALFTSTNPVSGGAATSTGYVPTSAGTYYWVATYNGDGNNNTITSGDSSEPVVVSNSSTPIVVNSVVINGDILDSTASITGATYTTPGSAGGTATLTTAAADGFFVGEWVKVGGVTDNGYNGTYQITAVPTTTSCSYVINSNPGATFPAGSSSGGSAINALSNAGTEPGTPEGLQRSMVDDIAYHFNQAVSLASGAVMITPVGNITVQTPSGTTTQTVGTGTSQGLVVTLTTPDGGFTWIATFSGTGVVGGSIANGAYNLDLNHTLVTPMSGSGTLSADNTQVFDRLYGDIDSTIGNSTKRVFTTDLNVFNGSYNQRNNSSTYVFYMDLEANNRVFTTDLNGFNGDYNTRYSGFTTTI